MVAIRIPRRHRLHMGSCRRGLDRSQRRALVSSEKRLAVQGPKGNRGERGEKGESGLSWRVVRAVLFLFFLSVALGASGLFWINHAVNTSAAAIRAGQAREQAEQQAEQHREQEAQLQAATAEFRALCTTFTKLAALKPPQGNPATNPSRAYLQGQHDTLDQLGTDLGCK
jgi:hypothetical protein